MPSGDEMPVAVDAVRPTEDGRGFYPGARIGVVDGGVLHEHEAAIAAGVETMRVDAIGDEELQRLAGVVDRWRGSALPVVQTFGATPADGQWRRVGTSVSKVCSCGSLQFAEVRGFGQKRIGFDRAPVLVKVTVCRLCGEVWS